MPSSKTSVVCTAYKLRDNASPQQIRFNTGTDLAVKAHGLLGPRGISRRAADLVDIAASIFQIERQLRGRQRTNPVARFELTIRVREATAWNERATSSLIDILNVLGNPTWNVRVDPGLQSQIPQHEKSKDQNIEQVALFSGGLDSACGALTLRKQKAITQLTSYYTGQKSLQADLAKAFGFSPPVQWSLHWAKEPGRGHSYFYRSFLFLALGAAVAESWGARRLFQFENGVLASAIPPAPSFAMTHHAHPRLHAACSRLFGLLFGGTWSVSNPFLPCTKRECVERAVSGSKVDDVHGLLLRTQTCWFFSANRMLGAKKQPHRACGVCIPCLLRRTAMPDDDYVYDLTKDSNRNSHAKGAAFRSYYGFLSRTLSCPDEREFYRVLPAAGRDVVATGAMQLADLYKLFRRFAMEFMDTYGITPESDASA